MSILYERKPVLLRCRTNGDPPHSVGIVCDLHCGLCAGDNDRFDNALAAVCAALSFSADAPAMLSDNLRRLGFGDIAFCGYEQNDPSRIGAAFAAKRQNGVLLIAVVLRGTQGTEWFSNFRIGYAFEHKGFSLAADDAEQQLREYLRRYPGERGIRFLITGYSRGGAAANLLARRLCDSRGADSVFCYTFASPKTAIIRSAAHYDGIRNLVREEDFFTRVPLTEWGYRRYGGDVVLSGDVSAGYRMITGEEYTGFTDKAAANAACRAILTLAPNVPAYYKRLYPVGRRSLSLYDYMLTVAEALSDETDDSTGEILLDSAVSQFADLSAFLTSGMDIGALLSPALGIPRCSVADSHSPAAYLAAMQTESIIAPDADGESSARFVL